jgi:ABC-type nitrate/sulfonate/bicarbonate transport system ATPase subunit
MPLVQRGSGMGKMLSMHFTPSAEDQLLAVRAAIRSFAFGPRNVLQNLELSVEKGESVALLGPSGCGKSTLIGLLAGLLPRRFDECFDGDISLFGHHPYRYRATGMLAAMFQEPALLPHLSVEENIRLPLEFLRRGDIENVDALVRLVGLDEFRNYLPRDLSGGMRTRTALARGFVSRPDLLFMDEPFTGLDLGWKESLYTSLQELRCRYGTTIVMVTHDLEEAVYNSGRIVVIGGSGTFLEQLIIPGTFPRDYCFGQTVSRHTETLSRLAKLLGSRPADELA